MYLKLLLQSLKKVAAQFDCSNEVVGCCFLCCFFRLLFEEWSCTRGRCYSQLRNVARMNSRNWLPPVQENPLRCCSVLFYSQFCEDVEPLQLSEFAGTITHNFNLFAVSGSTQ